MTLAGIAKKIRFWEYNNASESEEVETKRSVLQAKIHNSIQHNKCTQPNCSGYVASCNARTYTHAHTQLQISRLLKK